jgi:hypothetical protein
MLLACIYSYLKSVLKYKFLILDTYHPCTLYLCEQGCEDWWWYFEAKRDQRSKTFGKHWGRGLIYRRNYTKTAYTGKKKSE